MKDKRVIANFFLLVSILVFFLSHMFKSGGILVYLVQKASEAAIVGGFADWFAVTALFKHPLGLPIPHTNIIEKNRFRLIDSISKTVNDTWLSKQYLSEQINKIDAVVIVEKIINKQKYQFILRKLIRKSLFKSISFVQSKNFQTFINKKVESFVFKLDIMKTIKSYAYKFSNSQSFEAFYYFVEQELKRFIQNTSENEITQKILSFIQGDIEKRIPLTLKQTVDNYFDKAFDEICTFFNQTVTQNETSIKNMIAEFIENYKNKAVPKEILITLLESLNILDIDTISGDLISTMKTKIEQVRLDKTHPLRSQIKDYIFLQLRQNQDKINDKALNFLEQILKENLLKLKNKVYLWIGEKHTQEQAKQFFDELFTKPTFVEFYTQNAYALKAFISKEIITLINQLIKQNQKLANLRTNSDSLFNYLLVLINEQFQKNKDTLNTYIQEKLNFIMRLNHHLIGKTVKNYLEQLKTQQLIDQIESKVGNDLQYIRINGSLVGAIVGLCIAIVNLLASKV